MNYATGGSIRYSYHASGVNPGDGKGGALYICASPMVNILENVFIENRCKGGTGGGKSLGGAALIVGKTSQFLLKNNLFIGNIANGSDPFCDTIGGCIRGNPPYGGALYVSGASIKVQGDEYYFNSAAGSAAGDDVGRKAFGGALFFKDSKLELTNTIMAGNSAIGGNSPDSCVGGAGGRGQCTRWCPVWRSI